jgi:hypothetical protein
MDYMSDHIKVKRAPPREGKLGGRGYVYIIAGGGLYKIGTTTCVSARARNLQAECPAPLEIIMALEFKRGAGRAERWMHWIFRDCWHHAEWFRLSEADLDEATEVLAALRDGWLPEEEC